MPNELHGKLHQLLKSGKQGRPSSVCPDAGWAFELTVEGSNTTLWHWLTLVTYTVIAISLVALTTVAVIDSLTMRNTLSQEETSAANCEEQPRFRS